MFHVKQFKIKMETIAIIGGGPAGIMSALQINNYNVIIFEKDEILKTLLYTGNGRCNLSYFELNNKELSKFYPRGNKFLLPLLYKFNVENTIDFFKNIGVETYIQEDKRIFPKTNKASYVQTKLIQEIKKKKNITIIYDEIIDVNIINNNFEIKTETKTYIFKKLLIATGGNKDRIKFSNKNIDTKIIKTKLSGYDLVKKLGHKITKLEPSLCALKIQEEYLSQITGLAIQNLKIEIYFQNKKEMDLVDDLLFTHKGISGPLSYKISSFFAFADFNLQTPLILKCNLLGLNKKEIEKIIMQNPKQKTFLTLSAFIQKSFLKLLFEKVAVEIDLINSNLTKDDRNKLLNFLTNFEINIIGKLNTGEVVTAGGIDLSEINSQTLESKFISNLFFAGEILNIDGLTGGFNLQNCWTTGYAAGQSLNCFT